MLDKHVKNIRQIYIGNILESYYQSYQSEKIGAKEAEFWRKYDALDNNRSLMYGGDDKILITPEQIDPAHLQHICGLAGWNNVFNLIPKRQSDCICTDIYNDRDFFATLVKVITDNPGVEVIQYRHTPEYYQLVNRMTEIKLNFILPETVPQDNKFVEEYFHSKRGFRHLWEQVKNPELKISIPEGFITADLTEAIEAAWWFKRQRRDFVFKYNRGVQGVGVLLNKAADFPNLYADFKEAARKHLSDGIWQEPCIVVEELVDVEVNVLGGSPNVEMRIDRDGQVRREYACAQILDKNGKTFLGVSMNPEVRNNNHILEAFKAAELYGQRLATLGYRGVFDMDLVVSKENQLFAVEANLRRTGGTHAHEFCTQLLGNNYDKRFYISLQDFKVPKNKMVTWSALLQKYAYDPITKTGIIPANPDLLECEKGSILTIAPTKKAAEELFSQIMATQGFGEAFDGVPEGGTG
jgi:hypothetical protein